MSRMALILVGSGFKPSAEMVCPRNVSDLEAKIHLVWFSFRPLS